MGTLCPQRKPTPCQPRGLGFPGQAAAIRPPVTAHCKRGHGAPLFLWVQLSDPQSLCRRAEQTIQSRGEYMMWRKLWAYSPTEQLESQFCLVCGSYFTQDKPWFLELRTVIATLLQNYRKDSCVTEHLIRDHCLNKLLFLLCGWHFPGASLEWLDYNKQPLSVLFLVIIY